MSGLVPISGDDRNGLTDTHSPESYTADYTETDDLAAPAFVFLEPDSVHFQI